MTKVKSSQNNGSSVLAKIKNYRAELVALVATGSIIGGGVAIQQSVSDKDSFVTDTTAVSKLNDIHPGASNFDLGELSDEGIGQLSFKLPNGNHCVSIVRKIDAGQRVGHGSYLLKDNLTIESRPFSICQR